MSRDTRTTAQNTKVANQFFLDGIIDNFVYLVENGGDVRDLITIAFNFRRYDNGDADLNGNNLTNFIVDYCGELHNDDKKEMADDLVLIAKGEFTIGKFASWTNKASELIYQQKKQEQQQKANGNNNNNNNEQKQEEETNRNNNNNNTQQQPINNNNNNWPNFDNPQTTIGGYMRNNFEFALCLTQLLLKLDRIYKFDMIGKDELKMELQMINQYRWNSDRLIPFMKIIAGDLDITGCETSGAIFILMNEHHTFAGGKIEHEFLDNLIKSVQLENYQLNMKDLQRLLSLCISSVDRFL